MRAVARLLLVVFAFALPVSVQAVEVQRVVSPGGVEAWLVEDHLNPVISLRFAMRGGSELDPAGKEGLANLAAATMDEGAGDLDSQAFQGRLADRSIELKFNVGYDNFTGDVRTLTETADEAFHLLRLALSEPRFDAEPVARIKSQILAMIRRDSEDPGRLAYEELARGLFPGHGYGHRSDGTEASVEAIIRDDLVRFARTHIARDGLKVGVVGDISPERLSALLDETFGALSAKAQTVPAREAQSLATGRLKVIEKDVVQSTIAFGHGGPKRGDPDYYAAVVMNHILGGGSFTSRLYDEVREKRGLAYSVGTGLYPLDRAGLILGSAGTENARVKDTVAIVRNEWRRMASGEVGTIELDAAKTYITGAFPLSFTSTGKIARILVAMQLDDLGIDYLDKRNGYIDAVTLDDVKRVAAKYLDADKLDIVVVGKPEGLDPGF